MRLRDLRAVHVADMYARQLESLSANTVRQHHVVMKKAFEEAVRSNLIATNPVNAVQRPTIRASAERRALDESEIAALIDAARGTRVETPIRFAVATGLRQGELIGLRWQDVDLDAAVVTVTRSAGYVLGEGMKVSRTKTRNARRTIELSAALVGLLRRHRNDQRAQRLHVGPAWQEHGLVFPSSVGTLWTPHNLYRAYKKVVNASCIADPDTVNFHTLRHTAATQWLRAGADIHVVSRRLGHSSAAFTISVYGHLLRGMQRTAAEALDHLIG